METVIINRDSSKVDHVVINKLIWFSCLLSDKVHLISDEAIYFEKESFAGFSKGAKLRFFREILPDMIPNYSIEEFDKIVKEYFRLKEIKHKSQFDILKIMVHEKLFREIEEGQQEILRTARQEQGHEQLGELNESMDYRLIECYCPSHKGTSTPGNDDPAIQMLLKIVRHGKIVPMVDISVIKTSVYKEDFSFINYDGSLLVSAEPLFGIPWMGSLATEQVKIVRKDMMNCFAFLRDFFNEHSASKNRPNFRSAGRLDKLGLQFDSWSKCTEEYQASVDKQIYINYLRSLAEKPAELKLHIGYCSAISLLKMYRELIIIDDSMYLYIMDKLNGEPNLQSCMPLMVVETGE